MLGDLGSSCVPATTIPGDLRHSAVPSSTSICSLAKQMLPSTVSSTSDVYDFISFHALLHLNCYA